VSDDEGSLGDIRKTLAGITRRLDRLADAVGVAAAGAAPGVLLDEPTRAHLAGLESLLAIGRGTTPGATCLLGIDRALTQTRADCAAIVRLTGESSLQVVAERGFRLPLEPQAHEGILGRALDTDEAVQAGPRLGGPDALLDAHGLEAALAIPIPGPRGAPAGALLVGRRRNVPFEPDAVGALLVVADRLAGAVGAPAPGHPEPGIPPDLFASLDPARTARAVAGEAAARLEAEAAAVLLPDGEGFAVAGSAGAPDDAPGPGPTSTSTLRAVAATRRPWVPAPDEPADLGLTRCLGTTPRAVLPLSIDDGLVALLAVGSSTGCGTTLAEPFARAAAFALRNARVHAESRHTVADPPLPPRVAAGAGLATLGDIASLLALVLGRLASIRDRGVHPEAARDLDDAEEAAWRVAEAVRRLLGFAPGLRPDAAAPRDFAELVAESVREAEALWLSDGTGPPVTLDLEAVPPVRVHPEELRQVLHHLLQNAREAGQGAEPVGVRLRWDGATHVELAVVDRGRGMDPGRRARAAEPFFTTKGPGRLGVGLAVTEAMAARYGGALDIESAPGRGTTVRLRLPTAAGARAGERRADTVPSGHRRVLVVDDEESVRETLVQGLRRDGYDVHATADVGEAVALLGRECVDVVVTDLVLPGGSGLEVARTVKRMRPGTRVILLTGWPGRVDPQTLESHGIDAVVEKPVGLDALRATVAMLVGRAPAPPR
jgi:signal transduction histidine kinase